MRQMLLPVILSVVAVLIALGGCDRQESSRDGRGSGPDAEATERRARTKAEQRAQLEAELEAIAGPRLTPQQRLGCERDDDCEMVFCGCSYRAQRKGLELRCIHATCRTAPEARRPNAVCLDGRCTSRSITECSSAADCVAAPCQCGWDVRHRADHQQHRCLQKLECHLRDLPPQPLCTESQCVAGPVDQDASPVKHAERETWRLSFEGSVGPRRAKCQGSATVWNGEGCWQLMADQLECHKSGPNPEHAVGYVDILRVNAPITACLEAGSWGLKTKVQRGGSCDVKTTTGKGHRARSATIECSWSTRFRSEPVEGRVRYTITR